MPIVPHSRILSWHKNRLHGRLRMRRLRSQALGISKPYYTYESPGCVEAEAVPVLYLFRGHEREWVNMQEDDARERSTAIQDIDACIAKGLLPPMLVVMPGLNSANNHIPSLGINMAGSWERGVQGLGSGQFWTYLTDELLPKIDNDYPQIDDEKRLMAGFSLGGYTVNLLAMKRPGFFQHAAMYDGLFMWPKHYDPRIDSEKEAYTDRIWGRAHIFDPALGDPRDRVAMNRWNPTDMLDTADSDMLDALRTTTYWVACASNDGNKGNLHRARFLLKRFRSHDLPLGFADSDDGVHDAVFHPDAAHTWHWADRFTVQFLRAAIGDRSNAPESVLQEPAETGR